MSRVTRTWAIFAVAAALGIGAMGWVTRAALKLERREAQIQGQALLEERVRLALWRMESILAPLIATEAARPAAHYHAYVPVKRFFDEDLKPVEGSLVWLPSPLQGPHSPHVRLHFQVDGQGRWTSPRSEPNPKAELGVLQGEVQREALLAVLPALERPEALPKPMASPKAMERAKERGAPTPAPTPEPRSQQAMNAAEFTARNVQGMMNAAPGLTMLPKPLALRGIPTSRAVREGAFQPHWAGEHLLLVRRAWIGSASWLQGCWLDWPGLRSTLKGAIADLLPEAELLPAGAEARPERRLAALPLRLETGSVPDGTPVGLTPLRMALLVGWACALLGGLAIAVLMQQALALSERRGAFVSAVTHELRTPLTTFRMYAEMLAMGMVQDPKELQSFHDTLVVESDRLDHLVKNVLAYARLESTRPPAARMDLTLEDLLTRSLERLSERASQADFELVLELSPDVAASRVRTDPGPVEQILFNLVDNACKYAASGLPRSIHLSAALAPKAVHLRVRDHGPGLDPRMRARLFTPFSKSAEDAATSAPGVGLGLSLSRRLARSLGGELRLEDGMEGACFVLVLPRTPSRA